MNAVDVMSRTVIAISKDAPLSQAVRLMVDNHVSGLPVLDEAGEAVGMLTEGDLLQRVETGTAAKAGWLSAIFAPGRLAGTYAMGPIEVVVAQQGDRVLTASMGGTPPVELLPVRGLRFEVRGQPGITAEFELDQTGEVARIVVQPLGILQPKR